MTGDAGAVAALDCGTHSTRLLIVDGAWTTLERQMRITRLGEGVDATRKLSTDAVARTLAVLEDYRRLMDRHGVVRARLVATSAVRDALNAEDFLDGAARATGVVPELLSGLEEGRLSFRGATASLTAGPDTPATVLVVDIGGGSTELVAGPAPGGATAADRDVSAVSLDIGCVRVTERYLGHDPPRRDERARATTAVAGEIERARRALPGVGTDSLLVGLAGTVSTLAALEQRLAAYDRDKIHHAVLHRHQVEQWLDRLAGDDRTTRAERPGMVEGRVDVIVGGVLILAEVMAGFGLADCLVSEDDILDGLVASQR